LRWTAADGFGLYPQDAKGALLTIAISPVNDLPEFTMEPESDTLKYELGSEVAVKLTRQFDCYDKDGDQITGAEIGFKRLDGYQFREENDRLIFNGYGNITGNYAGGVLTLRGAASTTEYDSAIRSVRYSYVDAREFLLDMRSVYIQISDGQSTSAQHARLIKLIYTFEDLEIPAAFSPNEGDDVNRTWVISSPNGEGLYADAEIKVYNKNGLLLFQTVGLENPWTGIYNGSLLPTDTYYYTIDLHYNKVRYKGAVTLVR
jgi:gliding motility-associated-like protein